MPPFISANVLQPLIDVFETVLRFFHDSVGFGWGAAIIALTICVRAVMVPLAIKQYRSMQGMKNLQPKIKELQAKYKGDKQRLNQEMARFYQENKVNPFGSCLPLVVQMPVFISLYYMLRKDLRYDICPATNPAHVANPKPCGAVDAAHFLGIPDITDRATGTVLVVLLVLYVGSQLLSSILMASQATDRNQRLIFFALPFVFVIFIQRFPAGLLVYWITTNLWTVAQQFTIREVIKHPIREIVGGGDGGGPPDGKGEPAPEGAGAQRSGGLFGSLMARAADGAAAGEQASGSGPRAKGGGGGREKDRAAAPAGPRTPPPRPPRKKKKRSGRRR
jgi:YidC/Oxa1 family membrane protein insertase